MKTEPVVMNEESPVRLEALKGHLRILNTDFDEVLQLHLLAAIAAAESYTGQTFRMGTWRVSGVADSDTVATGVMPIRSVERVEADGKEFPVEAVETDGSHVRVAGLAGKRVEITFTAGYEALPYDIAAAILLIAARFFESPADSVEQLPKASTNLLRPHKRWGR